MASRPFQRQRLLLAAQHLARLCIDEKGTEAAGATAVAMGIGGGQPPTPDFTFHADHPFLFAIVDKASGLVLFMGRVSDPTIP